MVALARSRLSGFPRSPFRPSRRYDNWRVQEVNLVTGEFVRFIGEHLLVSPTGIATFGDLIAVSGGPSVARLFPAF